MLGQLTENSLILCNFPYKIGYFLKIATYLEFLSEKVKAFLSGRVF